MLSQGQSVGVQDLRCQTSGQLGRLTDGVEGPAKGFTLSPAPSARASFLSVL